MPWLITKINGDLAICKIGRVAFVRSWENKHHSLEEAIRQAMKMSRGGSVPIYTHDPALSKIGEDASWSVKNWSN